MRSAASCDGFYVQAHLDKITEIAQNAEFGEMTLERVRMFVELLPDDPPKEVRVGTTKHTDRVRGMRHHNNNNNNNSDNYKRSLWLQLQLQR